MPQHHKDLAPLAEDYTRRANELNLEGTQVRSLIKEIGSPRPT